MRTYWRVFAFVCLLILPAMLHSQQPDLSKLPDTKDKIAAWLAYCESLRLSHGGTNNFPALQQAGLEGIKLTPASDAADRSRFYFYAAFGFYYQVKFDSAQYYYYQSLHEAQIANAAESIAAASISLISINFQLRQPDKVDSCKNILQAILDTTHNKKILQDGYSGMASYYQQKSYYSTSQDFLLKSIALRQKEVDTTSQVKLKADYAIQYYMLYKTYSNTDVPEKSLAMLRQGWPYAKFSPPVYIRYFSSFTEAFTLLGNIDSALYYQQQLAGLTKNSPAVPSEVVSANLNIAKYYIDHKQAEKARPYIDMADNLAARSKSPILIYQAQLWNGRYLEESGHYEEAATLLEQSLPVAKKISREQYAEGLRYMAIAQKGAGNLNQAIQYFESYIQESDSLSKEKQSQNFADQDTRYETNRREQRIVFLDKDNQVKALELHNASRTRLFLILGLVALGTIALLLYFIYRNRENLNRILNERNMQLDKLNGELALANDTKTKLFSIIGHDLRSPISQIVQFLQLQNERPEWLTGESKAKHEQRLKYASENLLETMEDLLLWSKSQMKHFTPRLQRVFVAALMEKESALVAPQSAARNISLSQNVSADFIQQTDENFLSVIIRNLLQNAVKYSDENSTVNISSGKDCIYITNHSSGANISLLNDQLQARSVDSKRSGLGLQIIADLAKAINAQVSFDQPESGLTRATVKWQ